MPRPKSVEQDMLAAFERLKSDSPEVLPKGTPVALTNVVREAGRKPDSVRWDRYPTLHKEITACAELSRPPAQQGKKKTSKESATRRIKRLTTGYQKLLNINNALTSLNEELMREIEILKEGKILQLDKT